MNYDIYDDSFDDPVNRLLFGLNDAQRAAVTHKDGPLLVLAGPGSGKTRVVIHRVAWLLRNDVYDNQIAALTFTNKAADEMKRRLGSLVPGNRVWIGTFHRFCAVLLRKYARYVGLEENYVIYDADQSKKLLEEIVPKGSLPKDVDISKIAASISWAKNSLVSADDYCSKEGSQLGKIVEDAYPAYQAALKKANAVDFDDLLFHVAVLLHEQPEIRAALDERFRYILVDEYQDTNFIQYAIARALSQDYPNISVTGDPDQSIYGWRGANIQNILNFEQDFEDVKVVLLEQNYRSDKGVLRLADFLIKHNILRKDKDLFTNNKEGVPPRIVQCMDQQEEAETIAAEIASEIAAGKRRPRDYAIFYRMNALSRNLEYALKRYEVPFQLVKGLEFFNRKEVKDLCAYLQLAYNTSDSMAFKRIVNLPTRGIGIASLNRLIAYANLTNESYFEAARKADEIPGLTARAKNSLQKFVGLIDKLRKMVDEGDDLEIVLSVLIQDAKYLDHLRRSADQEEAEQRLANIQELLSEVREFDADFAAIQAEDAQDALWPDAAVDRLGKFLEQIALVSDVDSWDSDDDRVSLMTLHAAKGLEFPIIYLVALEEGVLPHERSLFNKKQLEEERRLLFVGLTRAKEEVRLSRTRFREYRGSFSPSTSSRFIFEFPKEGFDSYNSVDQWFDAIRDKNEADPNADVVMPKMINRQQSTDENEQAPGHDQDEYDIRIESEERRPSGTSQRQAVWESPVEKRKRYFQREETADFAEVDEPLNDQFDGIDEQIDDEVYYADEPQLTTEDAYAGYTDKPGKYIERFGRLIPSSAVDNDVEQDDFAVDYRDEIALRRKAPQKPRSFVPPHAVSIGSEFGKSGDEQDGKRQENNCASSVRVNSFVRHKKYGVGVVKAISGPSFDRTAVVSFLSAVGKVELSLNDPELSLVAVGRKT
jgi:DNA helicase-2/ATP-dependent DNA helicase PcrA